MAQKQGSSKASRNDKPGRPRGNQTVKTGKAGARKTKLTDLQLAHMGKGNFQKAVNALKNPR